jgi:hypothetical protein
MVADYLDHLEPAAEQAEQILVAEVVAANTTATMFQVQAVPA